MSFWKLIECSPTVFHPFFFFLAVLGFEFRDYTLSPLPPPLFLVIDEPPVHTTLILCYLKFFCGNFWIFYIDSYATCEVSLFYLFLLKMFFLFLKYSALHMVGKSSTTELSLKSTYPVLSFFFISLFFCVWYCSVKSRTTLRATLPAHPLFWGV
jgi:hypothetical protein